MSHGWDLKEVSASLRIRHTYLEAIEEDRHKDLPGTTYAVGFLRSYAEFLGLDPGTIVQQFKDQGAGTVEKPELYFPKPVPEGRVPGGAMLMVTVFLAAAIYGGWYYLSSTDRSLVDVIPPLPDRLVALIEPTGGGDTAGAGLPEGGRRTGSMTVPVLPLPVQTPATDPVGIPADSAEEAMAGPPFRPAGDGDAVGGDTPAETGAVAPVESASPGSGDTVATAPPTPEEAAPEERVPEVEAAEADPVLAAEPADVATVPATGAGQEGVGTASTTDVGTGPVAGVGVASVTPDDPIADDPIADDPIADGPIADGATAEDIAAAETASGEGASAPANATSVPVPPPAPPAGTAPPAARVYGAANQSRIQLRATQDSWVQVRDGNGDLLITRVLRPGEIYRVPDRPGLKLVTGNAGGLVVTVDGVEAPPIGTSGQVLRDIRLDAQHLLPGGTVAN